MIEEDIERLREVEGVGKKRIDMIKEAWAAQKEIREVMLFLQSHDVSSGYATKIFKQYGQMSIRVVKENPIVWPRTSSEWALLRADRIAEKLGFSKDAEGQGPGRNTLCPEQAFR